MDESDLTSKLKFYNHEFTIAFWDHEIHLGTWTSCSWYNSIANPLKYHVEGTSDENKIKTTDIIL
jgi:hypothetical protein